MTDIPLRIMMSVTGANAIAGALAPIASALGPAGVVGGALVAFGISSVKAASTYQQSMNMVQALTGSNTQQMAYYDAQLKQLAVDAGVGPAALSKGLYNVLSAGYQGAQAMQVLALATKDAKIGMTDSATTTNALTTILKAFSVQGKDFSMVNGEMLTTVTLGKMTMAQYAEAIGRAATTSMQYHVSMEQMNASIATLTANGVPSAAMAVTDFDQLVKVMNGNIGVVAKSLHKNGIAFNEAAFNAMSYSDKIKYLNKAIEEANAKHVHITGVTQQAAAALQILSQHNKEYQKDLTALSDKQGMAAATQKAWMITQGGFAQSLSRLQASFEVLQIAIGNIFLPVLTSAVNAITPLVAGLAAWIATNHTLTDSIANASTGMQPAIRHLRDMAMDLHQVIAYWLNNSMPTLRQQFQLTANVAQTQFLPALQGTSNWMISTGTPAYTSFAKLVRDLLGGSFQQAGRDAIKMGIDITQTLQGLPAKLQGIKLPKLKLDVAMPNLGGGGLGNLGVLLAPLFLLQSKMQGFLTWLKTTFGPAFNTVFGPIGDMIHRVSTDMKPWIDQLELTFNHFFGGGQQGKIQGTTVSVQGLGKAWKELWVIIGDLIEAGLKFNIILTMDLFPILGKLKDGVQFLADKLGLLSGKFNGARIDAGHALDIFHNISSWINGPGINGFLGLSNAVNEAFLGMGQLAGIGWKGITKWFGGLPDWFKTQWNRISDGFHVTMNGIGNFASNAAGSLVGIWRAEFNQVIDVINGMISRIDSIQIAGFGVHIALLPHLASGGTLRQGSLALVGERGPEVVALPGGSTVYPNGTGPSGAGGGVTNIFYISLSTMARSQAEVARLVDMLEAELSHRYMGQTPGYTLI